MLLPRFMRLPIPVMAGRRYGSREVLPNRGFSCMLTAHIAMLSTQGERLVNFRIGNVPRFFLETKKANEDLNYPLMERK